MSTYQAVKIVNLGTGIATSAYTAFLQRRQLNSTITQQDVSSLHDISKEKIAFLSSMATPLEQFKACCCQTIAVVLPVDLPTQDKLKVREILAPKEQLALQLVHAYDSFSMELPQLAPGVLLTDELVDKTWQKFG